ncbi:NAD-dependent epimerase/dehydratase family protein [Geminicoccus roseus]|uniref:NAD-dependent epimerase/dehydratase family protein n=1 Tax=Geminicoccus roseus TaxID=404900 RepID=UPI0004052C32|nr:NAD(P)-dependent oxidoreductase [Geminicoccus roseus]
MRVLMTGASSFTGAWMARRLAGSGAVVTAARRGRTAEDGPRVRERSALLARRVRQVDEAPFGSDRFLDLLANEGPHDILCMHGATVGDHRAADFDVVGALRADTHRINRVLERFAARGGRTLVFTGTVFEADEGRSEAPWGAIGGYGLAKSLTWQVVRHAAEERQLSLGKFVIPHPFGPMEKPGLTSMLAESWLTGQVPTLKEPGLVRDHIHVDLLAHAYARFVHETHGRPDPKTVRHCGPSGRVETIAGFTARFARALGPLFGVPTRWSAQSGPGDRVQPRIRCNTEPTATLHPDFDEARAFEELAVWYLQRFGGGGHARRLARLVERVFEPA